MGVEGENEEYAAEAKREAEREARKDFLMLGQACPCSKPTEGVK